MSEQPWDWSVDQHIPNDTAEGRKLLDQMVAELKRAGWSESDVFGVHLAVEEALVNAIKHGNGGDPDKQVHVCVSLNAEFFSIQITDQGSGFVPDEVPDPTLEENLEVPSGRGLMLMKTFMTLVEYNEKGNQVRMEKQLAASEPSES